MGPGNGESLSGAVRRSQVGSGGTEIRLPSGQRFTFLFLLFKKHSQITLMKIRILLLLSLICAAVTLPGVSAAEGKAKAAANDETELGGHMDKMSGANEGEEEDTDFHEFCLGVLF